MTDSTADSRLERAAVRGPDVRRTDRSGHRPARPGRLVGHPRHPELPRGRGRRAGQHLVPRRRLGQGQGRAGHHHLPAHPRPPDPGRRLRAGEDRDPHRHGSQPAAGRLDRPHHPGHRGRPQRGDLLPGPDPAGHRRRPGPAPRELPQGHRRLPLAGRAGLRGGARPDDLGQLAGAPGHGQRAGRGLHRLDRRAPVRLASTASPWPTATSPPKGSCAPSGSRPRASSRSACSGSRARRARTTPSTSATPRHRAGHDHHPRGQARAQPRAAWPTTSTPCASSAPRGSTTAATATPRSTSPRRSRSSTGIRPGSWAPPSCSIRTPTRWAEGLEGWHGVDQLGEDGANPELQRHGRALREAVRPQHPQRGGGAGLRHRPGGHPRHRQRRHPAPRGG